MKWIIIIIIFFSSCYNMRMHDYYGHMNNVWSDSMDCARKCHADSLALEYGWKMNAALDSMNYYYDQAHPGWRQKEAARWEITLEHLRAQQSKCNCK